VASASEKDIADQVGTELAKRIKEHLNYEKN
jgi:hypothetical protein